MDKNNPNIIPFKKKEQPETPSTHMFTLDVYMNQDEEYEVHMEINDAFDDEEIGNAMMGSTMKYMTESTYEGFSIDVSDDPEMMTLIEELQELAERSDNANDN